MTLSLIQRTSVFPQSLHKMVCIRTLPQVVHSQYIYWYETNIRMRQDYKVRIMISVFQGWSRKIPGSYTLVAGSLYVSTQSVYIMYTAWNKRYTGRSVDSLRSKRSRTTRTKFEPCEGVLRIQAAQNGARAKRLKVRWGSKGGERRARLPANPLILKNADWFSRLTSFIDWQLCHRAEITIVLPVSTYSLGGQ